MPQSAVLLGPGDIFRPIQPKIGRCLYGKFYVFEEIVSYFNESFPVSLGSGKHALQYKYSSDRPKRRKQPNFKLIFGLKFDRNRKLKIEI